MDALECHPAQALWCTEVIVERSDDHQTDYFHLYTSNEPNIVTGDVYQGHSVLEVRKNMTRLHPDRVGFEQAVEEELISGRS